MLFVFIFLFKIDFFFNLNFRTPTVIYYVKKYL